MRKSWPLSGAILSLTIAILAGSGGALRAQGTGSAGFSANAPASTGDSGTGLFSTLPFKLTLDVRGGYDDNVTTSKQFKQGSPYTNAGATAVYDFGDARTRLSLQVGAAFTYYYDNISSPGTTSSQYDIDTSIRLALTHKATPRLTLAIDDYIAYETEPDFTIAQGVNFRTGNYFFTQDKFTATYFWSARFATTTNYTLGVLRYDDSAVGFFENRWENTLGNEFRFLLAPTTTLVGEYRFQLVTYEDIDRDSRTHYVLAGFDHTFDPRLTMSVRGGAEFREFDPSGSETGPYVEGTLTYAVARQTSASWTSRYAIEEPDVAVNPSRKTFRTGLTAKHDFTPKINGSIGAYYEHDDYKGAVFSPAFTEQSADIAVSARYAITRYFFVELGYNHTNVWSDLAFREYTRNRYWAGLSVTF